MIIDPQIFFFFRFFLFLMYLSYLQDTACLFISELGFKEGDSFPNTLTSEYNRKKMTLVCFWGQSRFERATGHFNSTNSSRTWMTQKSWRLNPQCQCVLEYLSCRQMKNSTASSWLCTAGVNLLSECVSSPPRALQWSSTASCWLWRARRTQHSYASLAPWKG